MSIIIESGVTKIGDYAFYECSRPTSIDIPNSVTHIGDHAFSGCSGLTSIEIPNSVTEILSYAFVGCSNLKTVTIGSGVKWIYGGAFSGCEALGEVGGSVTLNSNPIFEDGAFDLDNNSGTETFPMTVTMNLTGLAGDKANEYWMTFYNKNYNFEVPSGTQIFKAAVADPGAILTLTQLGGDRIVKKNSPVILKSVTGSIALTFTTSDSSNDFITNNNLKGVQSPYGLLVYSENTGKIFVLNKVSKGVGSYRLNLGKYVGVGKAYLHYEGGGAEEPSLAREFFLFEDDDATGIDMPTVESSNTDAVVYDLQGRRVQNPTKGLYIVNGKKVIIK